MGSFKTGLKTVFCISCILTHGLKGHPASGPLHLKFDFGAGQQAPGYIQVLPDMKYSNDPGYGLYCDSTVVSVERNMDDALRGDFLTGENAFIFAVDVPEGNYNVIVTLGDWENESITTIKAESRRLMCERVHTAAGEFKDVEFTTNVRYSRIDSNESVKLKSREAGHPDWDNRLTVEFNNSRPCVCALEIVQTTEAVTVFLAGNSTVTDQQFEPWASWGQMLPRFFQPGKMAVANHAESGEALKSFVHENRLKKIMNTIRPGDYLFIQFGHNDQKKESAAYVEPFGGYKDYLKQFIDQARRKGANPVLVTPVCRRRFDENGRIVNTHGDYPEAMRKTAQEEAVPLIDLFEMSAVLFESLGIEGSKHAFVHYPAGSFPGQEEALKDDSHFNNYGAYQLSKCIVEGIRASHLEIEKYLLHDLPAYDPGHPDAFDDWDLPVSPRIESEH
ncbi:rhamnogalacturonan acetylesterase [bacterium]|nr:rhamnogalacturonan acetylesterase [bacterium]